MNSEARKHQIIAAFKRVPMLKERSDNVEWWASGIALTYTCASFSEIPREQKKGAARAQRDLEDLRDGLIAIANIIRSMPQEAHHALNVEVADAEMRRANNEAKQIWRAVDRVVHPLIFDEYAVALATAVERAREQLASSPPKAGPGAPRKAVAQAVTEHAANAYENLTGKSASVTVTQLPGHPRRGLFVEFLEDLFRALDIDASAASQVSMLRKKGVRKAPP